MKEPTLFQQRPAKKYGVLLPWSLAAEKSVEARQKAISEQRQDWIASVIRRRREITSLVLGRWVPWQAACNLQVTTYVVCLTPFTAFGYIFSFGEPHSRHVGPCSQTTPALSLGFFFLSHLYYGARSTIIAFLNVLGPHVYCIS